MTDSPSAPLPRVIAFFDFDGTLVKGDSLWPFLLEAVGPFRCFYALMTALTVYLMTGKTKDRRTLIKSVMLEKALKGRNLESLAPAVARLCLWPRWLESRDALQKHAEAGHYIVIASGSLDVYLKALLADVPHNAILCTEMESEGGVLTGRMKNGNCVRETKAERVAATMQAFGPIDESWAYGNAPHDLPMMKLVTHAVIV
ncbi:MAG: HAD family hydrolase [Bdellovibrionales bacterium]|jgi:HAD superfamily hydrolase (TIGR01490 family)